MLDWNWSDARSSYEKAIEFKPGDAEFHAYYSHYLWTNGRFNKALEEAKRAKELNPINIISYIDTMALYITLGRYDEAMEQINKANEIDPDNWFVINHLGRLYRKQGKYKEAI